MRRIQHKKVEKKASERKVFGCLCIKSRGPRNNDRPSTFKAGLILLSGTVWQKKHKNTIYGLFGKEKAGQIGAYTGWDESLELQAAVSLEKQNKLASDRFIRGN